MPEEKLFKVRNDVVLGRFAEVSGYIGDLRKADYIVLRETASWKTAKINR